MKKFFATILFICILSSFISCAKIDAEKPVVYDLSLETKIQKAYEESLDVDDVISIINKAVKIYESNDTIKVNSDKTVYKADVSHIDLEFAKTCTKDNYSEPFEFYRDYLYDVRTIAIELLMDAFSDENTVVVDIKPYTNTLPPTHIFYIHRSDDPAEEIKVVAWNDDLYYHEGEAEPIMLYPLPEQNEIEQQFWRISNQEEEIPLY